MSERLHFNTLSTLEKGNKLMQLTSRHTAANQHAIYFMDGSISSGWHYQIMTYQESQSVPVRFYWDIEGTFQRDHSEEVGLFDCAKTDVHVFPCYIAPQTRGGTIPLVLYGLKSLLLFLHYGRLFLFVLLYSHLYDRLD